VSVASDHTSPTSTTSHIRTSFLSSAEIRVEPMSTPHLAAPAQPRVRERARDAAVVMAFSAGTSVLLAAVLLVLTHLVSGR